MKVYTIEQASEVLQVSNEFLQREIGSGRLPASNIGRGSQRPRWRITEMDLGKYLLDCRTAEKPAEQPKAKRPKTAAGVKDYFPSVN